MGRIRIVSDLDECHHLWRQKMPQEMVSDLWETRNCFQQSYGRRAHFVVCEDNGKTVGLLPLSWNEENDSFQFFPGETWQGKTWLEQNRIVADSAAILAQMLKSLRADYCIRYLRSDALTGVDGHEIDEVGYLFEPGRYDFDMEMYFRSFSGKSVKRLKRELAAWEERQTEFRIDHDEDFELLVQMNLRRYGESSYFADDRFISGFRNLLELLRERGWLRMTTVLVEETPAAVDMGCLYNGDYTLMAGGTNSDFPGIAKFINIHHMRFACERQLESVDFLCGDFNWKTQFHLTPRPLYQISRVSSAAPMVSTFHPARFPEPTPEGQVAYGG